MGGKVIDFGDKKINKKDFYNNKKQFTIFLMSTLLILIMIFIFFIFIGTDFENKLLSHLLYIKKNKSMILCCCFFSCTVIFLIFF